MASVSKKTETVPANMQDASPNQGGNLPAMTNWIGTDNSASKARVPSTHLMSGESLAAKFGASGWDENQIRKILNNATNRQFSRDRKAYKDSHNAMMNDISAAGGQQQDQIRRAMATGMAQGTDATTALLDSQNAFVGATSEATTQSRNDINNLAYDYAAQLAENQKTAWDMNQQAANNWANIGTGIYGLDTQGRAADQGYQAQLDANRRQQSSADYATNTQGATGRYEADKNLQALIEQANINAQANRDVAGIYNKK